MSEPRPTQEEPPRGPRPLGPVATLVVLLAVILWGGTPTAVKYTTAVLPPLAISGIRFGLAAAFMLLWCAIEGAGFRLRRDQWGPCIVAGLLLFVQIATYTFAIAFTNASHGVLCINTFIFWVLVIEHFVTRHDRLTPAKGAGLVLAVAGVLLIVSTSVGRAEEGQTLSEPGLLGDLLMLLSAAILGIKVVYTKYATTRVEPGKLILWHDVIGTLCFVVAAPLFEFRQLATLEWERATASPVVIGLLYQGIVVGGFCFAAQTALLRRYSASQITVFNFLTPLFGTVIAVLFLGDHLSPWVYLGGAGVAAGILIVTLANARPDADEIDPVEAAS